MTDLERARAIAAELADEPVEGVDFVYGRTLRFVAYGKAEPQGSKVPFVSRSTGRAGLKEDAPKLGDWRRSVAWQAAQAIPSSERLPLIDGPVELHLTIYRPRPLSAKRWIRFPWTKPDTSKLLRAVEDALTGTLYIDDARIVTTHLRKRFGEPARAEIVVRELLEQRARK